MSTQRLGYKYTYYLFAAYFLFILLTMATANYSIEIWGLIMPGGIFVFPFTFIINDVAAETYGYVYPRLFVWLGIIGEGVFAFYAVTVSWTHHPMYFTKEHAYQIVFDPTIRFFFASVVGVFVGEFVNIYLLSKWKIKYQGKFYIYRALGSTALGQLALSCTVDVVAFWGSTHGFEHLINMIITGFIIKMAFAFIGVIPSWILVKKLKQWDNVDYFDCNTKFNPFSLKLF